MKSKCVGIKYKVYMNGHVYDQFNKFKFFIDDPNVIVYIFNTKWKHRWKLDEALENMPNSFIDLMKDETL